MSKNLGKVFFVCSILLLLTLVSAQNHAAPAGFVQTKGTQFILNGSPFLLNGFNSYWIMVMASEPSQRSKVSDVFSQAAAAGLSVCRTWAFSDGDHYGGLQTSPGVYNEHVFQVFFYFLYIYVDHFYLFITLSTYFFKKQTSRENILNAREKYAYPKET